MSQFTDALVVSPLADGHTWVVLSEFAYHVGEEGSADKIDVEIGFMTDFATVPWPVWVILPRWGKYGNATVIHDWLYWDQSRPRKEADEILFEAMGVLEVASWQKYLIFWAVRTFGLMAWIRNRWDRDAGFERVLSKDHLKCFEKSARPGLLRRAWRHYQRK